MGLSASQGRMLLLTARKSDLEFQAQLISQKRLILSQQLEEISRNYEEATTNRQMKIGLYGTDSDGKNFDKIYTNLTYADLVSGTLSLNDSANTGLVPGVNTKDHTQYISNVNYRLIDVNGAIVVSNEDEIPGFYTVTEEDSNKVGSKTDKKVGDVGSNVYDLLNAEENGENPYKHITIEGYGTYKLNDENGQKDYNAILISYTDGKDSNEKKYGYYDLETGTLIKPADTTQASSKTFVESKFTKDDINYSAKIETTGSEDNKVKQLTVTTSRKVTHSLGKAIKGSDGYYELVNNDGSRQLYIVDPSLALGTTDVHGNTTAPNYLQDCLRNGKYMLQKGGVDNDEKKFLWKNLSWDSTSNIQDSYYTEDDEAAKAEYERKQTQIQNQDKQYELELDNIETQHQAVETEIESVQKVMDDNIKGSFNTFNA